MKLTLKFREKKFKESSCSSVFSAMMLHGHLMVCHSGTFLFFGGGGSYYPHLNEIVYGVILSKRRQTRKYINSLHHNVVAMSIIANTHLVTDLE